MDFKHSTALSILFLALLTTGCKDGKSITGTDITRIPVIFDTDANNELDDQHALAYLLLNDSTFNVIGVTVNTTRNGGEIEEHYQEAERVVNLCGLKNQIPIFRGANGSFPEIMEHTGDADFDGFAAVDFIIKEARKRRSEPLVVLAVGKLTNLALALKKDPSIADRIRLVWLGSNYPDPGEYNQDNDTASMSYVLRTTVPFEMVTVRYGLPSGTGAVRVARKEIYTRMPGIGPQIDEMVTGRHGGTFSCFGDYSVSLFRHIKHLEGSCYRSLFDMAAVAIVKEPAWADAIEIPCPVLINSKWIDKPDNKRSITVWENFNRDDIVEDLYVTLEK